MYQTPPPSENCTLRPDAGYLITGGLGGVGIAVAWALVNAGARHLMLFGRGAPSLAAAEALKEMERLGATCTVHRGDVTVRANLAEAIAAFGATLPPLAGVIHAAGVVRDATITAIAPEDIPGLLAAKTTGAWNLHELTADLPLEFFVLFSSLSSVLGSPGQASYSAANAFLDCLACHRQARGLCGLSINWGPWADTGMARLSGLAARSRWAHHGITPFSDEQATAMFLRLAGTAAAQRCAAIVDWRQFRRTRAAASSVTDTLVGAAPEDEVAAPVENALEQFAALAAGERQGWLSGWLLRKASRILRVEEQEIAPGRSLLDLGFDSLMVMELLRAIHQGLDIRAYPREFYQYPSVDAFAAYLTDEMAPRAGQPALAAVLPPKDISTAARPVPLSAKLDIPVVFLLSAPRSGSTLLRVMLAGHPGLFCPPELHLLGYSTMGERRAALGESYLQEGLLRAIQELNGCSAEMAVATEQEWVAANMAIQTVYARLQEMSGGRILIDKSPSYAASLDTLRNAEALFTAPRYIHLFRHPVSVIDSFVRNRFDRLLGLDGVSPRDAAEAIWVSSNANVAGFFQTVDRTRAASVRYEDLVHTPAPVTLALCSFLGIPFHDALLNPYQGDRMTDGLRTQSVGIGDPGFLNHKDIDASLADAWRKSAGAASLGHEARRLAAKLNYEIPPPPVSDGGMVSDSGMKERTVEVRGLSLCLCSWGPPDGPPVLILHGALDQGAAWDEVAVSLAARGFCVFAPDHRGHGQSQHAGPEGSYHLMDFLADADTLLRQLTAKPVTLVGHSMGASLAAMLTAARPALVRRLVLVESILAPDRHPRKNSQALVAHLDGIELETRPQTFADAHIATQRLREFYPRMGPSQATKLSARLLRPCPEGFHWRWDERIRTLAGIAYHATFDLEATRFLSILSELEVPVTLVRGSNSEIVPSVQTARQLEVLRFGSETTLSGGHNLHVDCPAELARVISEETPLAGPPNGGPA